MYYNEESVMDKLRNIYSHQNSIENNISEGFDYLNKVLETEQEKSK